MAETNNPGLDKAWEIQARLNPDGVCRAAAVSYDRAARQYIVKSLGMDVLVASQARAITGAVPGSEVLLRRLRYFFDLSVLWYLVGAKDIALTGRMMKIKDVKGGVVFTRGSHVLPLDRMAEKYGKDREGFLDRGAKLGGDPVKFGDAAVRLYPFPRVPAIPTLWTEDEEFPARADLMFDSTCTMHLATDIIWSIAMMCVLAML